MKKQIKISVKKLKAMTPKKRQRSAPATKVIESKKKYKREKIPTQPFYGDGY